MVIKEDKNPHLYCDASPTRKPSDIIMNQVTPIVQEAPIVYGIVKIHLSINIYNTRISYPLGMILLAMDNIKACFWFAQIHAGLTGAFGFIADNYYNLATAMVFGSATLALSWEPFQRAIEIL